MKSKITGIILVVLSILLALIPQVISPVCQELKNGMPMKCHHMGNSVIGIGIVLVILNLIMVLINNRDIKIGINIASIILPILAVYMGKWGIGGCKNLNMPCQTTTIPSILLLGGILTLVSIFNLYLLKKENN